MVANVPDAWIDERWLGRGLPCRSSPVCCWVRGREYLVLGGTLGESGKRVSGRRGNLYIISPYALCHSGPKCFEVSCHSGEADEVCGTHL